MVCAPSAPTHRIPIRTSSTILADRISLVCSQIAAIIGCLTIVGWVTGIEALARARAGYIPMAPTTALAFALLGFGVYFRSGIGWRRAVAAFCTLAVMLMAITKLAEYATRSHLSIDALFIAHPESFGQVQKGRMAVLTAINFVLASLSLHCVMQAHLRRFAGIIATLVATLSTVILLGYLHGTPFLYGGTIIPVAMTTAVAFFLIGCSLIAASGPDCWPLRALSGSSARSLLLRWFLPTVIAGTILNDYLQTRLVEQSRYNPALVSALVTLAFALLISAIISQVARVVGGRIDRAESDRNVAQEDLRALNADLEQRITAGTSELRTKNQEVEAVLTDLQRSHEELKGAQLQLIHAEKMQTVGSLAAGVAHEVKNPLAIIEMGLECLKSQPDLDAESLQVVHDEMHEAVTRANNVISGLLDYSSSKELDFRACNLQTVIEKSLRLMRHEFMNDKITVVRSYAAEVPLCLLDPGKVEQVLVNLLSNACHAMGKGGILTAYRGAVRGRRRSKMGRGRSFRHALPAG